MKLLQELVPGCDKQWLSRAANVSAGAFKGDGADDAEEENNDFFYDSESDHVDYARREKINTRMKLLHELVPGCDKQWLSRAANVSAGDFKGDGADDAEEENNDFFYDSETDHVHY
ncbi:hypothetical protein F2Q70_00026406 [Brassica cretica]|uniref:Uncharacterized protein n=1 Tax=Brassica cretica TaxID=69181 RepID=A0A8S9L7S2_BRACR|nr:hypothetical protein F2Q70_00026406 [Brassica cretica]